MPERFSDEELEELREAFSERDGTPVYVTRGEILLRLVQELQEARQQLKEKLCVVCAHNLDTYVTVMTPITPNSEEAK